MEGDLLGLGQPSGQHATNGPPSGLTLNLSSNNPFRNRAASPNSLASPLPRSPFEDPPPRPTSRNPFLDPDFAPSNSQSVTSQEKMAPSAELFNSLRIDDNQSKSNSGQSSGRPSRGPPRGENIPPQGRDHSSSSHRPSKSQEEALKSRRAPAGPGGSKPKGGSPPRRSDPRLRRNSDSSIMEKPVTTEERRLQDMRREKDRRQRDGKGRPKKLDIIDQLDATSIYGTGLFHHDGPFDACNPHRNRKGSRRAPMQAFAKDSANNTIGGSGPLNKRVDHALFMGQEPHEASTMFAGRDPNKPKAHEMEFFDPKQRGDFEYGEETLGLGSSTFLEGAPATRAAIVRNQEESAQEAAESGLGRKKSVVQRFKSIKRGPRDYESGRVHSPEYYHGHSPRPSLPSGGISAGGTGERNPFFAEFDKGDERISTRRKDSDAMSPISPPPLPGSSLERRSTTDATMDSTTEGQGKQPNGGFLSRVKSLKGGRRQRPEPPVPEGVAVQNPSAAM